MLHKQGLHPPDTTDLALHSPGKCQNIDINLHVQLLDLENGINLCIIHPE